MCIQHMHTCKYVCVYVCMRDGSPSGRGIIIFKVTLRGYACMYVYIYIYIYI